MGTDIHKHAHTTRPEANRYTTLHTVHTDHYVMLHTLELTAGQNVE